MADENTVLENSFSILWENLNEYQELLRSKTAIIAYSGGKDSSLLLQFYIWLKRKNRLSNDPILFHLDHSIRDNSIQETSIVKYLEELGFRFIIKKKNIPRFSLKTGFSLEESGRALRYKNLHRIANELQGYIVTGHHSEDYLETIFIQLIRGGGWNSLKTLNVFENNRFRPLMLLPEKDRKYFIANPGWPVFEDESNGSRLYLRNRIRLDLIPLLLKEGANSEKIYRNFHDLEAPRLKLKEKGNAFSSGEEMVRKIAGQILESEPPSICKYVIDLHLKSLHLHPVSSNFLKDLLSKIDSRSSFSLENKDAWFWKSVSSDLYILAKNAPFFRELSFDPKTGFLRWNGKTKRIPPDCYPRSNQEGDKIRQGGIHRDLSELLREREIPVPIRKMLPILKRDGKTVMVCLRMWDARIEDIVSDDFRGAF
ncbi:tRNA(Ile)-lysidine synthetase [Leptospira inadai serovar Lyme str. 10]|uniref:tRNA(Ile)-lysidine synthase n=2 Tax=Leptospira inadai serovar Lyme TaxID=293084 RepID=V6HSE5_9LEPT|nr:tRNA lysidine(34) synthetase TilS [Leptospira inadai]EQA35519.1 tRNA(Ile)-lysidine synthetase [Leptospira inadai serovar Lyme str. 10]PNV76112.1 tRNA lysidine(34) synthetase TilS [Leptospira inadai serovar Lyme]